MDDTIQNGRAIDLEKVYYEQSAPDSDEAMGFALFMLCKMQK